MGLKLYVVEVNNINTDQMQILLHGTTPGEGEEEKLSRLIDGSTNKVYGSWSGRDSDHSTINELLAEGVWSNDGGSYSSPKEETELMPLQ